MQRNKMIKMKWNYEVKHRKHQHRGTYFHRHFNYHGIPERMRVLHKLIIIIMLSRLLPTYRGPYVYVFRCGNDSYFNVISWDIMCVTSCLWGFSHHVHCLWVLFTADKDEVRWLSKESSLLAVPLRELLSDSPLVRLLLEGDLWHQDTKISEHMAQV